MLVGVVEWVRDGSEYGMGTLDALILPMIQAC